MRTKTLPPRSNRRAGVRKLRVEGWPRGRRASVRPWTHGRIRPSTCHDVAKKRT